MSEFGDRGQGRRPGDPGSGDARRPRRQQSGASRPERGGAGRPERGGTGRGSRGTRGGSRSQSSRAPQKARESRAESAGAAPDPQDGPALPDEITGKELDPATLKDLAGLGSKATPVARHLVAAWQLLDSDPDLAVEHALAASARGARSAPVREAAGEALYAAGRYDKALSELRAAKRLSGSVQMLPVMADCERGLGRPERALALADSDDAKRLRSSVAVEMRIVASGARADLHQFDAALVELETPLLYSDEVSEPAARIRYAYADLLARTGKSDAAREWFGRAAAADADESTDASERRDALDRA